MSVRIRPPDPSAEPPDDGIRTRRWTRKEYYRAADLGLFRPDERLELLDGEILQKMSPQKPPHASSLDRTAKRLEGAFGTASYVRRQLPLVLGPRSEPEPDVAVIHGGPEDYAREHPSAQDTVLIVEIADTSLRLDRGRKRDAYARARMPEYWIVNLRQRRLEVYRDPSRGRYRSEAVYEEQESVTPLAAPGEAVRVSDLLPPSTPVEGKDGP